MQKNSQKLAEIAQKLGYAVYHTYIYSSGVYDISLSVHNICSVTKMTAN